MNKKMRHFLRVGPRSGMICGEICVYDDEILLRVYFCLTSAWFMFVCISMCIFCLFLLSFCMWIVHTQTFSINSVFFWILLYIKLCNRTHPPTYWTILFTVIHVWCFLKYSAWIYFYVKKNRNFYKKRIK